MEATWDKNGDIDRESFLAEVVDGKQKIVETLPKLGNCKRPKWRFCTDRPRRGGDAGADAWPGPWLDFIQLHRVRPGDRRDLRARRGRLHAALADLADHQLRPGRVRHAAGLLRAGRDEVRRLPFWLAALVGLVAVGRSCSGCCSSSSWSTRCCGTASCRWSSRPSRSSLLPEGERQGVLQRRRRSLSRRWCRRPTVDILGVRCLGAEPRCAGRSRSLAVAALHVPQRHAARAGDAGDGAEPDASRASWASGRADDPLHLPDQRGARWRSRRSWSARSISPSSPTARRSGWRPSSPPSSAASTRCAAPSSAASCSASSTTSPPPMSRRSIARALPLFILIVVILFRPQGLLGRAEERTV